MIFNTSKGSGSLKVRFLGDHQEALGIMYGAWAASEEPVDYTERHAEWESADESCMFDIIKALKMSPVSFLLRPLWRAQTGLWNIF